MSRLCNSQLRKQTVWGPTRSVAALLFISMGLAPAAFAAPSLQTSASHESRHSTQKPHKVPGKPGAFVKNYKLDAELTRRAGDPNNGVSKVIVTLVPGATLPPEFKRYARTFGSDGAAGNLDLINGVALELPHSVLKQMASHPSIFRVHEDRPIKTHNYRTAVTVGATTVQQNLGYTGKGIGIAVIDSGIATWHDDLTNNTAATFPYGNQRVRKFVDFVNGRTLPYDDNGHGSHVAGIIAGNGYDSRGEKAGIAPDATLVSLKVLDQNGAGTISNIIAALNWVSVNAKTYNIRVVNMSVGAPIHESYWTDPLTLAVKKVTDQGIVVVAAAGNLGKNAAGQLQFGAITAPGNAPWVLTVGASSTMGTLTRTDDTMASFSSSGPTFIDFDAKPDLVAPGVGTISLAVPGSTFYATKSAYLVDGKLKLASQPYLSLSGTSMASPVVAGTVALMLQANPSLTPNLVKALLQYTSQQYPGYSPLRQGAGFLNSLGAVRLAQYYKAPKAGDRMPVQKLWSRQIIWGNHRIRGGVILPAGNAWATNIVWGTATTLADGGDNIVWGTSCGSSDCGDNIVWGTSAGGDNIVWGTSAGGDNIVWGTADGGDNIVWGTSADGDNIVWGTSADGDNIVWGTDCGGADCDNVIWGAADGGDNIVWGTADPGDNIVWGTADGGDNIVWGTSADADVTWGEDADDATLYPADETEPLPSLDLEFGDLVPLPDVTARTRS
jgi:serine protease AprX